MQTLWIQTPIQTEPQSKLKQLKIAHYKYGIPESIHQEQIQAHLNMATHRFNGILFLLCVFCLLTFTASVDSNVIYICLHHMYKHTRTHASMDRIFLFGNACIHKKTITSFDVKIINPKFQFLLVLVAWEETKGNTKLVESWWRFAQQKICKQGDQNQPHNCFQTKSKVEILCRKRYNSNTGNFQWHPLFSKLERLYLCNQRV